MSIRVSCTPCDRANTGTSNSMIDKSTAPDDLVCITPSLADNLHPGLSNALAETHAWSRLSENHFPVAPRKPALFYFVVGVPFDFRVCRLACPSRAIRKELEI